MALLIDTQIRNDLYATGSIEAGGGFTGSLQGSASISSVSVLSFLANESTISTSSLFASSSVSSSHAVNSDTASYWNGSVTSASHAINSDTASLAPDYQPLLIEGNTYPITSSYSTTSSYSLTASYISGALTHVEKGVISGSDFSGDPKTFSVNYILPFSSTIYVYSVVGTEPRVWSVITETTGSTINSNSNQELNGFVYYKIEEI